MDQRSLLVDSHCHLDYPDLSGDLEAVMGRAAGAGVGTMVSIGTKLAKFPAVRAVAEAYPHVFCTVGVHPHDAEKETELDVDTLCRLADHPKVVGIGESGLDYYYQHSSKESQRTAFRVHIAAARRMDLPLIVHTRDADDDMVAILREEMEQDPFKGLIHCFSSSRALADAVLELGFYLSFSGILTFKAAESVRDVAMHAPSDRILVETDAPYLAPVPKRGKPNEPAYVAYTARKLADIRGTSLDEITKTTTENFFRLFSRAAP